MAIYDGTGALTDQQKMLASYSLIMKDTTIQQGDFVKYQDTFGNAFKTVQKDIENITKDIGMELLPVIAEVTPIIGDLAREFGWKLANAVKAVEVGDGFLHSEFFNRTHDFDLSLEWNPRKEEGGVGIGREVLAFAA
jgi:hypothetical protein